MEQSLKAKVFISCGQRKGTDEVDIAHRIAERLKERGFEPYIAVEQQSLRGLKENIFQERASSEYFLFVDFKREKLGETEEYRGSLFCHQELAIASFLEIPLIGFREEGVKSDDGILRFVQANCTAFGDKHTLHNVVADKIQQHGWEPNWKNQLAIEKSPEQPRDPVVNQTGKRARFFHITVRNLNPYKHAQNCYGFLEKVCDLSTGKSLTVRSIELKWAGYVLPYATILPSSYRNIDGFYVFHDSPNIARFNVFTDSTWVISDIKGPGDYELTYLVVADNFESVRSTFRIHLDNTLDGVEFEQVTGKKTGSGI